MTLLQVNQNEYEWHIRGEIDIAADASVDDSRGSNQTVEKTADGEYTVTVKGNAALKLVEILDRRANYNAGAPATALGCRVSSVTQDSTSDDIVIVLKTTATAGGSGIDTNATAATTLSYHVVLRFGKMDHPLRS